MRIGIIGAGAIGCLLGSLLARAGNEVTVVHRRRSVVEAIRKTGIVLHERNRILRVRVHADLSPADLSRTDLVIFAVKSYQTALAASTHRHRLGPNSVVLTLQNGLSNSESLGKYLKNHSVIGGATTEASMSLGNAEIVHNGKGITWIGELDNIISPRCELIASKFGRAQIITRVSSNIVGVIWAKTIVNAAINPVSALTGLSNGLLLRSRGLRESMARIVAEGVEVSKAEGVRLEPPDPLKLLRQVLKATSSNNSSMLQDVTRKKETEIRQMNGAIVSLGRKHNVKTPLNQLLTSMILALKRGS